METTGINTPTPAYDYTALDEFFKEITDPGEIARYLEELLYFLVYYEHKEGIQGYYNIYSKIFEFKQVLQTMTRREAHGNS
jgi:hypothetical protein